MQTIYWVFGIASICIGFLGFGFGRLKEAKEQGKKEATTDVELTTVRQGNAQILVKLDKMDSKMDNYQERLIRVEESTKSAHKRIDSLERGAKFD